SPRCGSALRDTTPWEANTLSFPAPCLLLFYFARDAKGQRDRIGPPNSCGSRAPAPSGVAPAAPLQPAVELHGRAPPSGLVGTVSFGFAHLSLPDLPGKCEHAHAGRHLSLTRL